MRLLAYLNRIVPDPASVGGGFHPRPLYILLNLVVPLIVGMLLALAIKIVHWKAAPQKRRHN
jgi:hypothetical protein